MSNFQDAIYECNQFFTTKTLEQKLEIANHGYAGAPPGKSSKGYVPPGLEGSYPKDDITDIRSISSCKFIISD